jgi:hypothetical protein
VRPAFDPAKMPSAKEDGTEETKAEEANATNVEDGEEAKAEKVPTHEDSTVAAAQSEDNNST